jgi:hypothetical protein
MRKSCASTGTYRTAPTSTACARSASTPATASVRGVDYNRGYKRGCNHSSANVLECEHGNLLLSFLKTAHLGDNGTADHVSYVHAPIFMRSLVMSLTCLSTRWDRN